MNFQDLPKSNLHTHTCYCDGRDEPVDIVGAAIDAGMEALGFSGHSFVSFDPDYSMIPENTNRYRAEIRLLREMFRNHLHILLGLEQDYYSELPTEQYDYLIGSYHYFKATDRFRPIDATPDEFKAIVNDCFGGDVYAFTRDYFEHVARIPAKTGCDILGHFDLISKFNADGSLFDERDRRYLDPAMDALDEILKTDVIFEINTGAAPRGWRLTPYPDSPFLRRIAQRGGRVTFSSDSHAKETLMQGFERAVTHAKASGIRALTVMTREGWKDFAI